VGRQLDEIERRTKATKFVGVQLFHLRQDLAALNRLPGLPSERRATLLPDRWYGACQTQPN
jgi:hypothetical protein